MMKIYSFSTGNIAERVLEEFNKYQIVRTVNMETGWKPLGAPFYGDGFCCQAMTGGENDSDQV